MRSVAWKDNGPGARADIVLATGSFDSNTGIWTKERAGQDQDGDEDVDLSQDAIMGEATDGQDWGFTSLLTGPDSEIKSVAFSPTNSALLATSSRDKSVWVWEEVEDQEWETVAVLAEHTGDVKCIAWHPEREVIASGSYDDTIRLWRDIEEEGDWGCVGVIEGHEGSVWSLAWEAVPESEREEGTLQREPRLASCSDDLSVRIWRRQKKEGEKDGNTGAGMRMPSIIKPPSNMQTWVLESVLPAAHVRSVYAVSWSAVSGMIVSCGGDGSIYVYSEQEKHTATLDNVLQSDDESGINGSVNEGCVEVKMEDADGPTAAATADENKVRAEKEWIVVAKAEPAHGEYEINHVCWAKRQDKGRRSEKEEIVISTGDEGTVRIWNLPEELMSR